MSKRAAPSKTSPPPPASDKTSPKPEGPMRMTNKTRELFSAEAHAQALQLRIAGKTYETIRKIMGWKNKSVAYNVCMREMRRIKEEPSVELRAMEEARMDELWRKGMEVLTGAHVVLYKGKVVLDPKTKERLMNNGPVLEAISKLISISERRSRLRGLDMPIKIAPTSPEGDKPYDPLHVYVPDNFRETPEPPPSTGTKP